MKSPLIQERLFSSHTLPHDLRVTATKTKATLRTSLSEILTSWNLRLLKRTLDIVHCVMGESKLEREKEERLVWSSVGVPLTGYPAQLELAGKEGLLSRLVVQRKTREGRRKPIRVGCTTSSNKRPYLTPVV